MATSDMHHDCDKLYLAYPGWGLPKAVQTVFAKKGLKQLYPWQAAALECGIAGNNLVYCAPTSGGKSLVAEMLMLARMFKFQQALPKQSGKLKHQQAQPRGLLVLPYLSIVAEKATHLTMLLEDMKWRVQGYRGETEGQPLSNKAERIAICSIEKANMAVNHLIQEKRLHELVSVVVDEAHMLADPHRGAALEMLLSKLVACRSSCNVQIVAMSATMSGLDSLSAWLNAHLFLTNFRPVPLSEHVVFEGTVFVKAEQKGQQAIDDSPLVEQRRLPVFDKDKEKSTLLALVLEVVREQHSVLVFCAGRTAASGCAKMLADNLIKHLGPPTAEQAAAREDLIQQLKVAMAGYTNKELEKMIAAGVAFHHAGLTHQERTVVEEGYRSGALLVLSATSTLAAGVNLPARRVILRTLWQGIGPVGRAQYLQMVGRAGRAGQSAVGESFLMARGAAGATTGSSEWPAVCKLLTAAMPVLTSQLLAPSQPHQQGSSGSGRPAAASGSSKAAAATGQQQSAASSGDTQASAGPANQQSNSGHSRGANSGHQMQQSAVSGSQITVIDTHAQPQLQQLLLHAVATGLVSTGPSVLSLLQSTLAYQQYSFDDLEQAVKVALTALRGRKLLSLRPESKDSPSHWALTPLGTAVVASTLPPDLGLMLHIRLSELMCCMVMAGHVHLLYHLQPQPLFDIYDWNYWCRMFQSFSPGQRHIADIEGVRQSYIDFRLRGMRGDAATDRKHARLAGAWLLDHVVNDASCLHNLEESWGKPNCICKQGISRGQMQSWQSEISKVAAMAALLANTAGWWQLETLLTPLAAQAAAGVRPELLPLMQVAGMLPSHAAALHAAGFHRPEHLVCASESEVAAALAAKMLKPRKRSKDINTSGSSSICLGHPNRGLAIRAAKSLLDAARQHMVLAATAQAADTFTTQQAPMHVIVRPLLGQATLYQAWPHQEDPQLQQLLDSWQVQPSFSFAVVLDDQQCAVPGCNAYNNVSTCPVLIDATHQQAQVSPQRTTVCHHLHCPRATALVLSWADREAAVLHLPSSATAANSPEGARVLHVVKQVFGDDSRTASCCDCAIAIAALHAIGVQCRIPVDDPCVAFLLWQPMAADQLAEQHDHQNPLSSSGHIADVLKAASSIVLGNNWRLQVPLIDNRLGAAAKAALLSRALMPPLRAALAQGRLHDAYVAVERPLQQALGNIRANGVRITTTALQEQLQQFEWQKAALQRRAVQLLSSNAGLDISTPSQVRAVLNQLRLGGNKQSKQLSVVICLQQAIRTALKNMQHQQLPLLRCMLSYWLMHEADQDLAALFTHKPTQGSNSSHDNNDEHVVLQPLLQTAALSGVLQLAKPSSVLSRVHTPCIPVVIEEGSLEDMGTTSLPAPTPVVALITASEPHAEQRSRYDQPHHHCLGMLMSIGQACMYGQQPAELPLHDFDINSQTSLNGSVKCWCGVKHYADELQIPTSHLHRAVQPSNTCDAAKVVFVPGTFSLLPDIHPSSKGCTFIGLQLEQLPLVVLAAMSADSALQDAMLQPDPMAAAAAYWLQHCGIQSNVLQMLLARVADGAVDGVPLAQPRVPSTLFSIAVDVLVHGKKASVQRNLLGLEQTVNLAASLLAAFSGVSTWYKSMIDDCRHSGYVDTFFRQIPFKLPSPGSSSAEVRSLKEAERTACSIALSGSCGDVERATCSAFWRCCRSCFDCKLVMCSPCALVAEAPLSAALPLLGSFAPQVQHEVVRVLGASNSWNVLFKWWWGSSLDHLQANFFKLGHDCCK